jgi:hypothetical protein
MAQLNQVSINESTDSENISLEEQAAAMDAKLANKAEDAKAAQTVESDRPDWLPEKFQSPEDMAKAYNELQSKLGEGSKEKDSSAKEKAEPDQTVMQEIIDSATNEFIESGELTDKSFKALEEQGLPREIVEAYVAGQRALMENQVNQVKATVGGEENYNAMAEWAAENLDQSELDAFNEVVESGSINQAQMAVRGLYSQFASAGGKAPNLIQGNTSGSAVKPFNSAAQVTEAMRDPRYKNDPAYRKTVEDRLAVTSSF